MELKKFLLLRRTLPKPGHRPPALRTPLQLILFKKQFPRLTSFACVHLRLSQSLKEIGSKKAYTSIRWVSSAGPESCHEILLRAVVSSWNQKQHSANHPLAVPNCRDLVPESGAELGEVLLKAKAGRRSETEATIYKSMGHAMEDLVAANLVYEKAIEKGDGKQFDL